ncbi:hypothetical protein HKBW3S25_00393 [Candidatus Hakubella thermalkaliphila]|uniref:Uncharacterized protein n=1 Tax=Candidatus Hakubella thermalkaliphila TaxID=2754717 RepID=A0A6V8NXI7_9ACTN|nr:hypothetical protein HKBW3S25_00393 [Candidatus Hakubella thermalkaliphila]
MDKSLRFKTSLLLSLPVYYLAPANLDRRSGFTESYTEPLVKDRPPLKITQFSCDVMRRGAWAIPSKIVSTSMVRVMLASGKSLKNCAFSN